MEIGLGYVPPPMRNDPLPFVAAWKKSGAFFSDNSMIVAKVLHGLFTHRLSISQLMGPVASRRWQAKPLRPKTGCQNSDWPA